MLERAGSFLVNVHSSFHVGLTQHVALKLHTELPESAQNAWTLPITARKLSGRFQEQEPRETRAGNTCKSRMFYFAGFKALIPSRLVQAVDIHP